MERGEKMLREIKELEEREDDCEWRFQLHCEHPKGNLQSCPLVAEEGYCPLMKGERVKKWKN